MKRISNLTVAAIGILAAGPAYAEAADEAAIRTVVEAVAVLADRGEFEALERLYAPEIQVDYTSLAGGEPQVKSSAALMTEWSSLLPGFDRTRHAIDNVRVRIEGVTAQATADVVADHWVKDLHWRVSGRYDYGLVKDGRDWKIAFHKFTMTDEKGARDVLGLAGEAAKATPNAYIRSQNARGLVTAFLTGLEEKDMAKVNAVWADDAVQEMPFAPANFPKRVVGKEAIVALYAGWPQNAGRAEFTDGIVFYPTRDPNLVAVEYKGSVDVVPTGRVYNQRYFGLFHMEDGKIALFREYFDPNAFAWAFGLEENAKR